MGVVYKAEDTRLHRFVALKFQPQEFAKATQAMARFQREAQAALALNHPNIRHRRAQGARLYRHEYLDGVTLRYKIGPARLGLARAQTALGDTIGARGAYQDSLALWKNGDVNIAVLK